MLVDVGLPQIEAVFEPIIRKGGETEKPRRQGSIERRRSEDIEGIVRCMGQSPDLISQYL